jgi:uncharacterized membrane protein YciS (DUF1049 family)
MEIGIIVGATFAIGWVVGFCCCWKMQVDHERIKRKYLRSDADIAKEACEPKGIENAKR